MLLFFQLLLYACISNGNPTPNSEIPSNESQQLQWHDYVPRYNGYSAVCSFLMLPMYLGHLPKPPKTMTIELRIQDSDFPNIHKVSFVTDRTQEYCRDSKTVQVYANSTAEPTLLSTSNYGGTCDYDLYSAASRDISLEVSKVLYYDLGTITCTASFAQGNNYTAVFTSPFYYKSRRPPRRRDFMPTLSLNRHMIDENDRLKLDVECSLPNHKRHFNMTNINNYTQPYYLQSFKILDSGNRERALLVGDILRRTVGTNLTVIPTASDYYSPDVTCYYPSNMQGKVMQINNIINTKDTCYNFSMIISNTSCEQIDCAVINNWAKLYRGNLFVFSRRTQNYNISFVEIDIDSPNILWGLPEIHDLIPIPIHRKKANITVFNTNTEEDEVLVNYIPKFILSKEIMGDLYAKIYAYMATYSRFQLYVMKTKPVAYNATFERDGEDISITGRRVVGVITCGYSENAIAFIIMSKSCALISEHDVMNKGFNDSTSEWCGTQNGKYTVVEAHMELNNKLYVYKKIGRNDQDERDAQPTCVIDQYYCLVGLNRRFQLKSVVLVNPPPANYDQNFKLERAYNKKNVFLVV